MTKQSLSSVSDATPPSNETLYKKVGWRLLPLLMVSYMVAYVDRVNVGYAKLQMTELPQFDDAVYAFGAGLFFVGYVMFEVPSNLLMQRIGARKTLLRIMFIWGLIAAGMMFVQTPLQFYVMRFLLGVFEAGFLPGVVLYLTYWYPLPRRGQVLAILMAAVIGGGVIAGPASGAIMKYLNGVGGLAGWQWLFLTQGLPASFLGIIAYLWLQDRPDQAHWLTSEEKERLKADIEYHRPITADSHGALKTLFRDPRVYALALSDFLLIAANYALVFWIPSLIKGWGVEDLFLVGIYAAIPQAVGIVAMILVGRNSDRTRERRWHYALSTFVAATGLGICILTQGHFAGSLAGLCVTMLGLASALPLFLTVVTEYLAKPVAAGGIAFINSLALLGGFASPIMMAQINSRTGDPSMSMYFVAGLFVLAGVVMLAAIRPTSAPAPQFRTNAEASVEV
jgi:sugar phosphate permease